jgi:glycosyltransferase involved in cell wall biosynthesis
MRIAFLTTDSREHFKESENPQPYFGTAPQALLEGFAQCPEVEVHVISCVRQPLPAPEKIADNIWYHALLVSKLGWMSTGYQGCIRAVRRKLREVQPDIVHGQGTERDCAISAVFSGFPNVLTIHGNMRLIAQVCGARPFSYAWLNAHLEAFTIPRSGGVICITRYTEDAVRSLARHTWLLPNAVDERFFGVQPAPVEPPVILCVGLVCYRKNQNRFIRALDHLAARRPLRVRFLGHAGDDEYAREFRHLIAERPWCELGGFADRDSLRGEFARAAVVALPSLEDNCPMVVLEAMAAGVPAVAANVGGVPDLITPGRTGAFCDPLNEESMASAIEHALESRVEASLWAAAAKEEAIARFHPKAVARRHVEIYREVLQRSA